MTTPQTAQRALAAQTAYLTARAYDGHGERATLGAITQHRIPADLALSCGLLAPENNSGAQWWAEWAQRDGSNATVYAYTSDGIGHGFVYDAAADFETLRDFETNLDAGMLTLWWELQGLWNDHVMSAPLLELSRANREAIKRHGQVQCIRAYEQHLLDGIGAAYVAQCEGLTTRQADAIIDAGRALVAHAYAMECHTGTAYTTLQGYVRINRGQTYHFD